MPRVLHVLLAVVAVTCAVAVAASRHLDAASLTPVLLRHADPFSDYVRKRAELVAADDADHFAADIKLSPSEEEVDAQLQKLVQQERANADAKGVFPPAHYFPDVLPMVESSPLLAWLRRMPKAGVLHAHADAVHHVDWLISVTYWDNAYVYNLTAEAIANPDAAPPSAGAVFFYAKQPSDPLWQPLTTVRSTFTATVVDEALVALLSISRVPRTTIEHAWRRFDQCFLRLFGIYTYVPAFKAYYVDLFKSLIAENISYIELRLVMPQAAEYDKFLYSLDAGDAAALPFTKAIDLLRDLVHQARASTVDGHFDARVILCGLRRRDSPTDLVEGLKLAAKATLAAPDMLRGWDTVGFEDGSNTHSLLDYAKVLLEFRRDVIEPIQARGDIQDFAFDFFFHAGESNWQDRAAENIYDALLLGSRRIGHGLALGKHPHLMQLARKQDVMVEVCPVSNQMLEYVPDLRNHPAVQLMRAGVQIALSPDDNGIMNYNGVSDDWYEATLAWQLDLRSLKKLALNSLSYSAMPADAKAAALASWHAQWDAWISDMA